MEGHVPWICLPQGILPAVHSRYTHRSSALPGSPLGGLPSLSLTTEGSWIHLGERVAKPLVSPLMLTTPLQRQISEREKQLQAMYTDPELQKVCCVHDIHVIQKSQEQKRDCNNQYL